MNKQLILLIIVTIILIILVLFIVEFIHKKDIKKFYDKFSKSKILDKYQTTTKEINDSNNAIKKIISSQDYKLGTLYMPKIDNSTDQLLKENENAIELLNNKVDKSIIDNLPPFAFFDKGSNSIKLTNELLKDENILIPELINSQMMFTCIPQNESLVITNGNTISENTPYVKYYGSGTINGLIAIAVDDDASIANELLIKNKDPISNIKKFLKDSIKYPYIFIFSKGSNSSVKKKLNEYGIPTIDYKGCYLGLIIPTDSTINNKKIENNYKDYNDYYIYNGVSFPMKMIFDDNFIFSEWKSFKKNLYN